MAVLNTRRDFANTEEGKEIKARLQEMEDSLSYSTTSSYSANTLLYPDNLITFADKHMDYLSKHPALDANKYLANIRLMTRVR
jgi:hypothetical protein